MKKALFGFVVLTLIFATSCKKNSSSGNTWTFKGTTYSNVTSSLTAGDLNSSSLATNLSNINSYSTIDVTFPNGVNPTAGGTFTVVNGSSSFPSTGQVSVSMTTGGTTGTTYTSTGGNGTQTVTVTVSGSGSVSVSTSNVTMYSSGTDSSALSINTLTH